MTESNATEQFVTRLTDCQQRLYAFILSLVHDIDNARDVLQETNLVLWRRAGDYDKSQDFVPWAIAHARTCTLAYLRDRGRDRHLFNPKLLALIADEAAERVETIDDRRRALHVCMSRLPEAQRELINRRYHRNESNDAIAESVGRSMSSVAQQLYRIRQALLKCIRERTAGDGGDRK